VELSRQAAKNATLRAIIWALIVVLVLVVVAAVVGVARATRARQVASAWPDDGAPTVEARTPGEELRKQSRGELLRPRTYEQYKNEVEGLILRAQELGEFGAEARLAAACATALTGGKRLRAVVLMEIARCASERHAPKGVPAVDVAEAALFIEYTHAAALVIDDMPAFDSDTERRGRAALHVSAGQAVAQMAAYALMAAGLQNVCRQLDWLRARSRGAINVDRIGTRVFAMIGQSFGAAGAAGGQCADLGAHMAGANTGVEAGSAESSGGGVSGARAGDETTAAPGEEAERATNGDRVGNDASPRPDDRAPGADADALKASAARMQLKTTAFFELAAVMGWLLAGGPPARVHALRAIGRSLGAAFQIADDIGDMAKDANRRAPAWNYANVHGRAAAESELERQLRVAQRALKEEGLWSVIWGAEVCPMVRQMSA
jgi:geranylgeranyl diphosphate synthase type II